MAQFYTAFLVSSSLLLVQVRILMSTMLADIYNCSNRTVARNELIFVEGSNFSLCCQLGSKLCNSARWSDGFTIVYGGARVESDNYNVTRVDMCLVQMDVENATNQDSGKYLCVFHETNYDNKHIEINERLESINITKFVVTYDKTITVSFDRGVPQEYSVTYTVTMIRFGTETVMCNGTYPPSQTMCRNTDRVCVCQYTDTFNIGECLSTSRDDNVTIVVTGQRHPGQLVQSRRSFSVLDNIIPGPLTLNGAVEVSANHAVIQMCADVKTKACIYFAYSHHSPIVYHVLVYKNDGIPQFLNVAIPSVQNAWCLRVRLSNLSAFTNYSMTPFISGGGGPGNATWIDFKTAMSVPTHPPKIDSYSFCRCSQPDKDGTPVPAIIIMWNPLLEEVQGGSNLTYVVQVMAVSGFKLIKTVPETFAFFSDDELITNLTIHIWAQNDKGRTNSYSQLNVPPVESTKDALTYVEFDGDQAAVYVYLYNVTQVQELAVHWCQNYTENTVPGISICQEQPMTSLVTETVKESMQFHINTSSTPTSSQEIIQSVPVEYMHEDSSNSPTGEYQQAIATLTTHLRNNQEMEYYRAHGGIKLNSEEVVFREREKRSVGTSHYGHIINGFRRKSREVVSMDVDNTRHPYPLVFISLVTTDGNGYGHIQRGLIPADCLYDRQKNAARVNVTDITTDESTISLSWNQECQSGTPDQFMADYFCVSVSVNGSCEKEQCHPELKETPIYYNSIGTMNTVHVPLATDYVCFHAYSNNGKYSYTKWPQEGLQLLLKKNSQQERPSYTVEIVAGCTVGAVTLGLLPFACYRRYKYHKETLAGAVIMLNTLESPAGNVSTNNQNQNTETTNHSPSDSGSGSGTNEIVTRHSGNDTCVTYLPRSSLDSEDTCVNLDAGPQPGKVEKTQEKETFSSPNTGPQTGTNEMSKDEEDTCGKHGTGQQPGKREKTNEEEHTSSNVPDSGGSNRFTNNDDESEEDGYVEQDRAFQKAGLRFHYYTSREEESSGGQTDNDVWVGYSGCGTISGDGDEDDNGSGDDYRQSRTKEQNNSDRAELCCNCERRQGCPCSETGHAHSDDYSIIKKNGSASNDDNDDVDDNDDQNDNGENQGEDVNHFRLFVTSNMAAEVLVYMDTVHKTSQDRLHTST